MMLTKAGALRLVVRTPKKADGAERQRAQDADCSRSQDPGTLRLKWPRGSAANIVAMIQISDQGDGPHRQGDRRGAYRHGNNRSAHVFSAHRGGTEDFVRAGVLSDQFEVRYETFRRLSFGPKQAGLRVRTKTGYFLK